MRLNNGEALYVNLSQTAYYSNEHYQESAENKGRNPICLIFHFQTIVDKNVETFQRKFKIFNSIHLDSSKQKTTSPPCPLSQCWA